MLKHIILLIIIGFLFSCEGKKRDEAVLAKISDSIPMNEDIVIYSTPGSHKLNVFFRAAEKTTTRLMIFTEDGRLISQCELKAFSGVNTWEVPISSHHAGMVLIQFAYGKKIKTMKVML